MTRRILFASLLAIFVALTALSPAFAADDAPSAGSTIKKKDLEKDGYKCEVVSAGFVSCTKGDKEYWCTSGECTAAPKVTQPGWQPVQPAAPQWEVLPVPSQPQREVVQPRPIYRTFRFTR